MDWRRSTPRIRQRWHHRGPRRTEPLPQQAEALHPQSSVLRRQQSLAESIGIEDLARTCGSLLQAVFDTGLAIAAVGTKIFGIVVDLVGAVPSKLGAVALLLFLLNWVWRKAYRFILKHKLLAWLWTQFWLWLQLLLFIVALFVLLRPAGLAHVVRSRRCIRQVRSCSSAAAPGRDICQHFTLHSVLAATSYVMFVTWLVLWWVPASAPPPTCVRKEVTGSEFEELDGCQQLHARWDMVGPAHTPPPASLHPAAEQR